MKSVVHRILSSLLALLVLASTVSWTVEKHICMGTVVDIALFGQAQTCGMMDDLYNLNNELEDTCCDDESFTVEGQDDLKISFFDLDFKQQAFVLAFVQSYTHLLQSTNTSVTSFLERPPPLLTKDYQVLYETFLI